MTPTAMLEQASNLLVKHKIGGLPVIEQGKVVGIITATDLMRAFTEFLEGSQEGVSRIDLSLSGDASELAMVVQHVAQESGKILRVGCYQQDENDRRRVSYVRLRSDDANRVARILSEKTTRFFQFTRKRVSGVFCREAYIVPLIKG